MARSDWRHESGGSWVSENGEIFTLEQPEGDEYYGYYRNCEAVPFVTDTPEEMMDHIDAYADEHYPMEASSEAPPSRDGAGVEGKS